MKTPPLLLHLHFDEDSAYSEVSDENACSSLINGESKMSNLNTCSPDPLIVNLINKGSGTQLTLLCKFSILFL